MAKHFYKKVNKFLLCILCVTKEIDYVYETCFEC